jgi:hypothetical protein
MDNSVTYQEIIDQNTLQQAQSMLQEIQDQIIFYCVILVVLVPMTLLINGVGLDSLLKTGANDYALAIRQGCQIGLDNWYISFTVLCGIKLLIQLLRFLYVKTNSKESVIFHLGGNFIMMPILFTVFFVYT